MFNIGSTVSEGVREFAETGSTDTLEKEVAEETIEKKTGNNFLDAFIAPPIVQGVGDTSTNIFVDTNNTKVCLKSISTCEI